MLGYINKICRDMLEVSSLFIMDGPVFIHLGPSFSQFVQLFFLLLK